MTSAPKKEPTVTIDFSTTGKRGFPQIVALWLWLGSIFFFLVTAIAIPTLYIFNQIEILTVWIGLYIIAAMLPIDRKLQPQWCLDLGMWMMKKASEYFRVKMVLEDADAVRTSGVGLFAMEPHDVLPLSIQAFNDCLGGLPGHKCNGCVTSFCFNVPFMKHAYTWVNAVSADKKNMIRLIQKGISPVLCPGGVQEVTLMENDKECVLFLNSRLGFVKLAMQHGIPIFPVFSFGLRASFTAFVPKSKLVHKIARMMGFLPMVFFGMWGLPLAPAKPADYTIVIGTPIKIPKTEDPSLEEIKKYHKIYVEELTRIFEENKAKYGMGDITLRIV